MSAGKLNVEKLPQIKEIPTGDPNHGKFLIENLKKGYGITVGNALRRVLLSSIPGVAFVAVDIAGVQHEFSAMDGVMEDVTDIIMNLKEVVLTIDPDELFAFNPKQKDSDLYRFELDVEGPAKITAGSLIHDSSIEVVNKDLHIAEVVAGGHFSAFLYARRGIGYVGSADNRRFCKNSEGDFIVGLLAMDAIYTPVTLCRYDVEERTDANGTVINDLTLEVHTNGSILPRDAVAIAGKFLIDHLDVLLAVNTDLSEQVYDDIQYVVTAPKKILLRDLEFNTRISGALERNNIKTVDELTKLSEADLHGFGNIGKQSIKIIKEKLAELGFTLKQS